MRRRPLLPVLCLVLGTANARADDRIGLVVVSGDAQRAAVARASGEAALEARGARVVDTVEGVVAERRSSGVEPADLEALGTVESLLVSARDASAELDEAAALRLLATAAREVRALLHVEGAASWLAEVEMRTGAVAAQVGMTALAEDAFRRAYRLDPSRELRSGEAPPEVVALAESVARRVDAGPRGVLTIHCADPSAEVTVDDRPGSPCPARLELPTGSHAVRVTAPGRRPYGALVELSPGDRAPMEVALAPDATVVAARAFDAASRERPVGALPDALRELAGAGVDAEVIYVAIPEDPEAPALGVRCEAEGCTSPVPLVGEGPFAGLEDARLTGGETERALAAASASQPREIARTDSGSGRRRRIALITTALVVAAGVATGLGVGLSRDTEQRLEVVVRPPSP